MFILDYVIYRIVAVILEMFWDKIVLGSRLYNTRGYTIGLGTSFYNLLVPVPISIEYILFGCNEISEEFNTLLFKSVQKLVDLIINYPQPWYYLNTIY
jgi:hypothetical protein